MTTSTRTFDAAWRTPNGSYTKGRFECRDEAEVYINIVKSGGTQIVITEVKS